MDDHRVHMQYEIERQDREWRSRHRRHTERVKSVLIAILTVMVAVFILWGKHR